MLRSDMGFHPRYAGSLGHWFGDHPPLNRKEITKRTGSVCCDVAASLCERRFEEIDLAYPVGKSLPSH